MNFDNLRLFFECSGEGENEFPKYMQNSVYVSTFLKENLRDFH